MPPRTYRALLIANSTFPGDPHNLPDLEGPRNDPALLRDALCDSEVGLFPTDNVRLVTERTMAEVLREVEDFLHSSTRQDTLLIYYSGHGTLDQSGELFLCTRDTRSDRLRSTAVKATDLRGMLDESSAATTVIALDCCHAGRFKGGDLPAALAGHGRFVITSSRSGELANDAHARNHASLFTHHLVEGLLRGADDHDGDGVVTLTEIYDYVHAALGREGKQVPHKRFEGDGEVPIARRAALPVATYANRDLVEPAFAVPILDVSETQIDLGVIGDDETLPVERVAVVNRGGGTLEWTADSSADWVRAEVETGALALYLEPSVGPNRANVFVRDLRTGAIKTVRVSVRVRATGAAPVAAAFAATPPRVAPTSRPAPEPAAAPVPAVPSEPAPEPVTRAPTPEPVTATPEPVTLAPTPEPVTASPEPVTPTPEPAAEARTVVAPPPEEQTSTPTPPSEGQTSAPEPAATTTEGWWSWPSIAAVAAIVTGVVVIWSNAVLVSGLVSYWGGGINPWLRAADSSDKWGPGFLASALCGGALVVAGALALTRAFRVPAIAFCTMLSVPLALLRLAETSAAANIFTGDGAWTTRWFVTAFVCLLCLAVLLLGGHALQRLGAISTDAWAPAWLAPSAIAAVLGWGIASAIEVFDYYGSGFGSAYHGGPAAASFRVILVIALMAAVPIATRILDASAGLGALSAVAVVPLAASITDVAFVLTFSDTDGFTWDALLLRLVPALVLVGLVVAVPLLARRAAPKSG